MSQHQWADRPGLGGWTQSPVPSQHTHIHTCTHPVLISLLHSTPSLSRIIQTSWQHLDWAGSISLSPPLPRLTQRTDWRDQKPAMKACMEARGGLQQRGNFCHTAHRLLSHHHPLLTPPLPLSSLVAPGRHAAHFHHSSSSLVFQQPLWHHSGQMRKQQEGVGSGLVSYLYVWLLAGDGGPAATSAHSCAINTEVHVTTYSGRFRCFCPWPCFDP